MDNKVLEGVAKVVNGKLIITDGTSISDGPWIVKGRDINLIVDNKEISGRTRVSSESKIKILFHESTAKRNIDINISKDRMIAKISISYTPEIIYTLEDTLESPMINLNAKVKEEKFPPRFTGDEVLKLLKGKGIIYGIDNKLLNSISNMDKVEELIIARGKEPIQPIDDVLQVFFDAKDNKTFKSDPSGNIDFKSIGSISGVKKDAVIAKRTPGKNGEIGINLFSKSVQPRNKTSVDMITKKGCKFIDKDTIIATIEGKPQLKGSIFEVNSVYEVIKDVDITTGDIDFIGDVIINGDVKEGMKVKSGNAITIKGNALRCSIWSEGELKIKGSAISSEIKVKSEFSELKEYIDQLVIARNTFDKMYNAITVIKNSGALEGNVKDCDIIKLVLSTKFPMLSKIVNSLLSTMVKINDYNNDMYRMLKIKYATGNYRLIGSVEEVNSLKNLINEKLEIINSMRDIKSDARIGYLQDCTVECSGNLIIDGKGVYKSDIYAGEGIYFISQGESELRGGKISAETEIKTKVVGTKSGVTSELEVGKNGNIYCDIAHVNTKFRVGKMETIIDESFKNVHVYIDKDKELTIDKFKI